MATNAQLIFDSVAWVDAPNRYAWDKADGIVSLPDAEFTRLQGLGAVRAPTQADTDANTARIAANTERAALSALDARNGQAQTLQHKVATSPSYEGPSTLALALIAAGTSAQITALATAHGITGVSEVDLAEKLVAAGYGPGDL